MSVNDAVEKFRIDALERFRKWKYEMWSYPDGLRGLEMFADLFALASAYERQTADEFLKSRPDLSDKAGG